MQSPPLNILITDNLMLRETPGCQTPSLKHRGWQPDTREGQTGREVYGDPIVPGAPPCTIYFIIVKKEAGCLENYTGLLDKKTQHTENYVACWRNALGDTPTCLRNTRLK